MLVLCEHTVFVFLHVLYVFVVNDPVSSYNAKKLSAMCFWFDSICR